MKLLGKRILVKLQHKNRGNVKLTIAIDQLIQDLSEADWANQQEMRLTRPDADRVHPDGANILWAGSHDEYERTFGNNKKVIEKWLRSQGLID